VTLKNRLLIILGYILDYYGWCFCECSFRFENTPGFIYKLGCWFYDQADNVAWSHLPLELSPWELIDKDGKKISIFSGPPKLTEDDETK
tara:strand:- start:163 stop:429 length:267 start_codon:yes stop_codon:yes gene_type:complete